VACSETLGTIDHPGRTIGQLTCVLPNNRQPCGPVGVGAANSVASSVVSMSKPARSRLTWRSCICGTRS
jgi:hypothetical protein